MSERSPKPKTAHSGPFGGGAAGEAVDVERTQLEGSAPRFRDDDAGHGESDPSLVTSPSGSRHAVRPGPLQAPDPHTETRATVAAKSPSADRIEIEVSTDELEEKPLSEAPLPKIRHRFGRYGLLGRLATGGMAEIYLAREETEGATRHVVIKRVLPHITQDVDFAALFLNEARVAVRLTHPNICHVYEFGREDGQYFIALEYVEGATLNAVIRRMRKQGRPMPMLLAVKVIAAIADALDHAHTAQDDRGRPLGIVHRDVSPHNIMVSYRGTVKLLDFGVAKASTQQQLTQAGQVRGKFAYMSPQQCTALPVDGRSDVFSLGICLYELLTGKWLYRYPTQYEMTRAIIEDPPPSIREVDPELPEALDAIVQKCLAKAPKDRFDTAGLMNEALEQFLVDQGRIVTKTHLSSFMREIFAAELVEGPKLEVDTELMTQLGVMKGAADARPRWQLPAAALTVLLVLGAAAWGLTGSGDPEQPTSAAPADLAVAAEPTPEVSPEPSAETVHDAAPAAVPAAGQQPEPAQAPEVATASHGSLSITTDPPGAQVTLNGENIFGRTPLAVRSLDPGTYEVVIRRTGRRSWTGPVEITAGTESVLDRELMAEVVGRARISVNTRPWSKVYVGRRLLGTTPISRVSVPAGTLQLRLVDGRGQTHRRTVRLSPNQNESVFFPLNR